MTAKTVLMKACSGDDKVSVETRRETCGVAIDAKLLEENELVTLCSTNVNTCKPVIEKGGLSEDHVFQFCMENEGACGDALPALHDNEHRAEAEFLDMLANVEATVIVESSNGGDDAAAASDAAACHKDTDCKGDRICSNGDCVAPEAGGKKKKAAAEPAGPKLGVAQCDAIITSLNDLLACPKFAGIKPDLGAAVANTSTRWSAIGEDHRASLATRCGSVVQTFRSAGAELGCTMTP